MCINYYYQFIISENNVANLKYAEDTILTKELEEKLRALLDKVIIESV